MARTPKGSLPRLRLHKPSGRAVVTLNGHDHYVGAFGTKEAQARYHRLITEMLADQPAAAQLPGSGWVTINELVLRFIAYGERHYRRNGEPTGELENVKDAVGPLCQLYGDEPCDQIDYSRVLKTVREEMIRAGTLARTTINARINRIRRVIRYGVDEKLVPPHAVAYIDPKVFPGLQAGRRDDVREPKEREPATEENLVEVAAFMPRPVAAMAWLTWLTTCRPEDAVIMRGRDLTFNEQKFPGDTNWYYRPGSHLQYGAHKNAWRGHTRVIAIGPRAQDVIRPFLHRDPAGQLLAPDAYLFSPREATEEYHRRRALNRQTKRYPYEAKRRLKREPRRRPGERYTVGSFRTAVTRACQKAGKPQWTPNLLRHGRIDEITDNPAFGIEGANALAGHRRIETTQIYRRRKEKLAARVAAAEG